MKWIIIISSVHVHGDLILHREKCKLIGSCSLLPGTQLGGNKSFISTTPNQDFQLQSSAGSLPLYAVSILVLYFQYRNK